MIRQSSTLGAYPGENYLEVHGSELSWAYLANVTDVRNGQRMEDSKIWHTLF